METGFLNFHDEEQFTTSICEQSSGFENDSSLFGANEYLDSFTVPWDQKFSVNVNEIKVEPNCNEDYEKTFNAWNQHLKELDNSIKCEGGIFIPGLDDPVFNSESCNLDQSQESLSSTFIKHGGENIILPNIINEDEVNVSFNTAKPCNLIVKSEPQTLKPVLEAGDLKTLLEQFEAASKPASPKKTKKLKSSNIKSSPTIVNKSIKEALPKEVIERIRESCKRRKEATSCPEETLPDAKPVVTHNTPTITSTSQFKNSNDLERVKDEENGKLLRLEHNYCYQGNSVSTDSQNQFINKNDSDTKHNNISALDYGNSKKDSGLESGELTDSSSIGSPSQMCHSNHSNDIQIKQEIDLEGGDDGSKKKKKLKLEEYWERRKKMKCLDEPVSSPSQPNSMLDIKIKSEPEDNSSENNQVNHANIDKQESNCTGVTALPKSEAEKAAPKPTMVSVEVQTADVEIKKEEKPIDKELQKKKEMWLETMRSKYRPRYSSTSSSSSSSSSSYDSKSYSRRKPTKTSRKYRRRCDSSYSRSRSRSRSKSSSSSSSSSQYSSGRSRSKSRRRRRSFSRNRSRKYSGSRSASRRVREDRNPFEKQKQIEERRVVYVGQIEDGISKQRLRDRFHKFGQIVDISLHFRERGDNYGFVTFKYSEDAYQAVEHGNDYGLEPKYDICFGGRRAFCKQRYSDLDSVGTTQPYGSFQTSNARNNSCNSFDMLLREAQENLRKRSAV